MAAREVVYSTPVGRDLLEVYASVCSLGAQLVDLADTPGLAEDVLDALNESACKLEQTETPLARAIVRELHVGELLAQEGVL